MTRERKRPSRCYFLNNEVTHLMKLVKSRIILKELDSTRASTPFSDGSYGQEIITQTLINLINKNLISDNELEDYKLIMNQLSLSFIIRVVNRSYSASPLELIISSHLANKELSIYEENYLLSDDFPIIKSKLLEDILENKKNIITSKRGMKIIDRNIKQTQASTDCKSIYDSEYYNSGLDIDQQSQEFWEDIL